MPQQYFTRQERDELLAALSRRRENLVGQRIPFARQSGCARCKRRLSKIDQRLADIDSFARWLEAMNASENG